MALAALGALAGCGGTSAPGPWHEEGGEGREGREAAFRWRELADRGKGRDGFTALDAGRTGITFANAVSDSAAYRNRHLMHGSGVALGDVDGDGLTDIYLARIEGPGALYRNLGGWRFEDITARAGVALSDRPSTGAMLADLDGDGDDDLVVLSMGGGTTYFENDGRGVFSDATGDAGLGQAPLGSTTVTAADVEGDGDLDLYVANYKARNMLDSLSPQQRAFDQVVRKIGDRYEVIPERRADYRIQIRDRGVSLIQRADPDWFFLNDGRGRFTREPIAGNPRFLDEQGRPLETEPEDFGLAARFHDVNGDGAPELYVANDFEDPDQFWINDGRGQLRLIERQAVRRVANSNMAVDFSDIDRNGTIDLFQVDMLANDSRRRKTQMPTHTSFRKEVGEYTERAQWQRNALLLNRGDGTFAEIADYAGVSASGWSWSTMFLDVDLDGFDDLLIGTGHTWDLMDADMQERIRSTLTSVDWRRERSLYPSLALRNVAFRNRGDLTFEDASERWRWGTEEDVSHGIAAGDLDGDGDLDAVVNRLNAPAAIMRNDAAAPRLAVRLAGRAPNTRGVGARIVVRAGSLPLQSREVTAGGLYLSGSSPEYAFAAGRNRTVAIEVRWRDGSVSQVPEAVAGRLYEIRQPPGPSGVATGSPAAPAATRFGSGVPAASPAGPAVRALFEDVTAALGHRHHQAYYNDYVRQPTLSLQLSQLGPGVSWIDVDADGDDDLLVPDGAGGELAWYRNDRGGGKFTRVGLGVAAGELDFTMGLGLPVGDGTRLLIGRSTYRAKSFADALTIAQVGLLDPRGTTGRGGISAAVGSDTSSLGAMALADVDGDGDLDLFVGARVTSGAYPLPASSHLYLNEGGRFTRDAANEAAFRLTGMVSAVTFTDFSGDGRPDLALATDWGPVRLFQNEGGRFREVTAERGLAGLLGGWKGIGAGDFDADGRIDLVATNWGRNVPFRADSAAPLYMYVGNFGAASSVDMVLAAHDDRLRAIAPLASFSQLAWAIPDLRIRIPTFSQYADASIDRVIGPTFPRALRLEITTLDHVFLLNRGDRFEVRPLPREAQLAPAFAAVVADFDGDGFEDLFLGQNFSQTEVGTPRFDAGAGLVLLGDGKGGLRPQSPRESGVRVFGDQRGAAAADYDGDRRVDLAVAQNAAETRLYRNATGAPGLRVVLRGPRENPQAVGATVRIRYGDGYGPAREVRAGAGYWSSDGLIPVLGLRGEARAIWVRWPGGRTQETPMRKGATEVVVTAPPGSR